MSSLITIISPAPSTVTGRKQAFPKYLPKMKTIASPSPTLEEPPSEEMNPMEKNSQHEAQLYPPPLGTIRTAE